MIDDIRRGERPPRPTDPSQNRWLQDPVWDMIATCWSDGPQQRCELPIMHHVFSMPSYQDPLVELPLVGRKNLILLAEELLYTFLILPLDPHKRDTLRTAQEYISNVISRDGASTISPSAGAAGLAEKFREVSFPC
jgi:hypothetical protein